MSVNLTVFGDHDEATIRQMHTCLAVGGERGVLCADGHKGYAQPVGGVVAYKDMISISGVGFDIACGNLAVKTDAKTENVRTNIQKIMDDVFRSISFGMGRANNEEVDHPLFESDRWKIRAIKDLKPLARSQLGTVGGGNHYVDIFVDEADFVWVGVHFGSRGFGHKTATAFLHLAGGQDGMDVAPTVLPLGKQLGQDYIEAMTLAGEYAYAGREWVVNKVVSGILKAKVLDAVHNHHNFAWKEEHNGEPMWVVRKGATPAFPGQRGFVGGSMGDDAVILEGVDSETSKEALYSTVHGAGRIMSRTAAKGKFVRDEHGKKQRQPGRIRHDDMMKWIKNKGVTLRGADVDESPQAYRRLKDVLAAHADTVRILHTLRPIGVAMAGADVFDPFRD